MPHAPIIGVISTRIKGTILPKYYTTGHYIERLEAAGAAPVQLPLSLATGPEQIDAWLALCDGFLLPGGGDFSPALYGEAPLRGFEQKFSAFDLRCQRNELALIRRAAKAGKPMLGICLGEQAINIAFGGTLVQDVPTQVGRQIRHAQAPTRRSRVTHTVDVAPGTLLRSIVGTDTLWVNTYHHQAVKQPAPGFTVSARAADGLPEAIEMPEKRILGVQWHPENLAAARPEAAALFRWLVNEAR